jgi:hypothetical protein
MPASTSVPTFYYTSITYIILCRIRMGTSSGFPLKRIEYFMFIWEKALSIIPNLKPCLIVSNSPNITFGMPDVFHQVQILNSLKPLCPDFTFCYSEIVP